MIKIAIKLMATSGNALTEMASRLSLEIPEATNIFSPSGGVAKPTAQQQISTIPKWIGSTPKAVISGRRTGVTSIIIASVSMNMPRKSRKIATMSQTRYTLSVKLSIHSAM